VTQFKRWLDDDIPLDVARMLRAGQAERPRKNAVENTLVAFATSGTLASTASTAVAATSKTLFGINGLTAKWVTISFLGLVGAITTAKVLWSASSSPQATIPSAIPSAETRLAVAKASEEKTSEEKTSEEKTSEEKTSEEKTSEEKTPSDNLAATDAVSSVSSAESSREAFIPSFDKRNTVNLQLAQEMQVIDRARTALQANNPRLCLRILDEHRRTFTRPRLNPESAYLRMQAAQRLGDRSTAMTIAREIVRRYPNSPHVGRAEALLQRESEVPDSL
jgi:Ulp1 family protease